MTKISKFRRNADGSVTVPLLKPVQHGERSVSEVTLRGEPTVADLEAMDKAKGEVEKSLYLIAELSGLSVGCLRKVKAMDFAAIGEALNDVLGNGSMETGET